MIWSSVLFGVSLFPLILYLYPPVVWTMMFKLWNVLIYSEGLYNGTYLSNWNNENLLSLFLNIVTRNLMISRYGHFLLDGNPNLYEVTEHIDTNLEVNPRMLSTLKNAKSIWSMDIGGDFEWSIVVSMGILVALVRRQIGQGYFKLEIFFGRPFLGTFNSICLILIIDIWPKRWWIIWDRFCFEIPHKVGITIFLFLWGLTFKNYIWRQSKFFWVL